MVTVIDYGLGNLRSVCKALETVGARVRLTDDPALIKKASALVLPGVGAFARGMENLGKKDLVGPLQEAVRGGVPLLGICLGLQLLFTLSEEHGVSQGLDLVPGKVVRFKPGVKIPHMGWNTISFDKKDLLLLEDISPDQRFYFVHSYYVAPAEEKDWAASAVYGQRFCAAICKDNIWGVQFHPEKSGSTGLQVLRNFLKRSR